jgi:hypothetical protein
MSASESVLCLRGDLLLRHDMQLLAAPARPGLYLDMAQQLAR